MLLGKNQGDQLVVNMFELSTKLFPDCHSSATQSFDLKSTKNDRTATSSKLFDVELLLNTIAFRNDNSSLTFGDLEDQSLRIANIVFELRKRLIVTNQTFMSTTHRVAIYLPVSDFLCSILLGCINAGSLIVYLDPDSDEDRVKDILSDFMPHFLIAEPTSIQKHKSVINSINTIDTILQIGDLTEAVAQLSNVPRLGKLPLINQESPCLISYTSGSTGKPKGVVLSFGNLRYTHSSYNQLLPVNKDDQVLCLGSWGYATLVFILSVLRGGGCVHYLDKKISRFPVKTALYLEQHAITTLSAPDSFYHLLQRYAGLEKLNLSQLKYFEFWGEPVRKTLVQKLLQKVPNASIVVWYCCSEAFCTSKVCFTLKDLPDYCDPIDIEPLQTLSTRIVASPGGSLESTEGCLEVTGNNVMLGYWDDISGKTAADIPPAPRTVVFQDWVRLNSKGRLEIFGRLDGIVKISGNRVSLSQVETVLTTNQNILTAIAWKSQTKEKENNHIVAAVSIGESKITEKELKDYCTAFLPRHSIPREVFILPYFPLTASGKTNRNEVIKMLSHKTKLASGGESE